MVKEKAITREEVRLTRRGVIATLPERGCRAGRHKFYGLSTIERLWLPLVRKLSKVEMPKPWGSSPRQCLICGRQFFVAWRDRYRVHYVHPLCSDRCAAERRNMYRRQRRKHQSEERQKDLGDRICLHCGAPVHANRNTKRYCSVRCRVASSAASRSSSLMLKGRVSMLSRPSSASGQSACGRSQESSMPFPSGSRR